MTRAALLFVALVCALQLAAPRARAFSISSGLTRGCHEAISAEAFRRYLRDMTPNSRPLHLHKRWKRLAAKLALVLGMTDLDEWSAFILMSLVIGVRSPDTNGHSVSEIVSLRGIHADPDPDGQYMHALRGPKDDGLSGDAAAVAGTQRAIRRAVHQALEAAQAPRSTQIGKASVYFDFYGVVDVPVFLPAYHFGRTAHTVQDSFAHAIRDEASDLHEIVHVLNYVEAITDEYSEHRDGVAHSGAMDSCEQEMQPRVEAATLATLELLGVLRALQEAPDSDALQRFFARWFQHRFGCHVANQMCGNPHWLEVAREHPAKPYLFGRSDRPGDVYDGRP